MRALAVALVVLIAPLSALAGDGEQAPPIPTPGLAPRPGALAPARTPMILDEDRLAEVVDAAVERAMARRPGAAAVPFPAGWTPPHASPQSAPPAPRPAPRIVPAEPARRVSYVPAYGEERQYVQVLVPAPPHRRALAAVGERLVRCGAPRTRTMRVAPAAVAVATCPAAAPFPSGQSD